MIFSADDTIQYVEDSSYRLLDRSRLWLCAGEIDWIFLSSLAIDTDTIEHDSTETHFDIQKSFDDKVLQENNPCFVPKRIDISHQTTLVLPSYIFIR